MTTMAITRFVRTPNVLEKNGERGRIKWRNIDTACSCSPSLVFPVFQVESWSLESGIWSMEEDWKLVMVEGKDYRRNGNIRIYIRVTFLSSWIFRLYFPSGAPRVSDRADFPCFSLQSLARSLAHWPSHSLTLVQCSLRLKLKLKGNLNL